MADRYFNQDGTNALSGVVTLDLDITLGTSGATTGVTPLIGKGISGISSSGSGVYVVTFQDGYVECLNVIENTIQATYSATGAVYMTWTTDAANASPCTVTLTARTAAGAAVQPATGDCLKLTFRMLSRPISQA